jgi:dTDP-4-amino-4,6-dideoxygalactose transaminase
MKPFASPIYVTRPSLPPLHTFAAGLQEIWDSRWLTNHGPVLRRFESKLKGFLQAENLSMFTNGALALMVAMQGLRLTGEVITTPFTFVASTNAITQCGMQPIFADIALEDLTLDPDRIEALITPRTSAILAVHVFGIPCQLDRLGAIAARHGLALIYDAAHAFGMTVDGRSIANFGDVSMFSFHATKLYHTIEGGALTFGDQALAPVFDALCNHGLEPDGDVRLAGLNAKMSEVQALMGELMLDTLQASIAHGHRIDAAYRERLKEVPGLSALSEPSSGVRPNYSFFPVLVDEAGFGMSSDELKAALLRYNVHVRRYFTPLISDMTAFRSSASSDPLNNARRIGPQVMALPTYADLAIEDVHRICDLIAGIQRVEGIHTMRHSRI